jgi:hypothetical protein
VPDDVSGDIEQKPPGEPTTGLRRLRTLWPWTWFALTGVATLGWLIGLGWAALKLARWLTG